MKHGVDKLALITTDGFRIGAQDQLRIYGKILGIAVHSIHDEASLKSAIDHLSDKKLVLIDTAGLGQRDERVAEQIAMLRGAQAKRLVVLNATADAETLDHVVATFADRDFAGCVVTKTDEAMRLGPVLDAVIRHRLRIHHVSTGQKVPEDLERPDTAALVAQALAPRTPAAAFALNDDDAPAWMAAMNTRATALDARSPEGRAGRGAAPCLTRPRGCEACSPDGARRCWSWPAATRRKAGVAVRLARDAASAGRATLLVDGTPGELARACRVGCRHELAHVVAGDVALADVVRPLAPRLLLLPAARALARVGSYDATDEARLAAAFSSGVADAFAAMRLRAAGRPRRRARRTGPGVARDRGVRTRRACRDRRERRRPVAARRVRRDEDAFRRACDRERSRS